MNGKWFSVNPWMFPPYVKGGMLNVKMAQWHNLIIDHPLTIPPYDINVKPYGTTEHPLTFKGKLLVVKRGC